MVGHAGSYRAMRVASSTPTIAIRTSLATLLSTLDSREYATYCGKCHNGTRHKEYIMPSPRKASPAHGAEAEMSSKKKVASPAKAAGKAQGEKSPQMTKQRPKNKSKA